MIKIRVKTVGETTKVRASAKNISAQELVSFVAETNKMITKLVPDVDHRDKLFAMAECLLEEEKAGKHD